MTFLAAALISFFGLLIGWPILQGIFRLFGVYVIVQERECLVYTMFGKVVGMISEPGLHFLPSVLGPQAFFIHFFGNCQRIDLRLDQQYLRSLPVNSEEGTPMGIGVWYEMIISDPIAFLYKNTDPRGSLRANVSNSTVRSLSNMKLEHLLENRHEMSRVVREEVSPLSNEWGYRLGSVYVRKVHFRDAAMIRQIEEKVVNRLKQVTAAIRQDGANQVSILASTAERQSAIEFAKAAAMRPYIVGMALQEISKDPDVAHAMFEILENQKMLEGDVDVTLIPEGLRQDMLTQLLADRAQGSAPS
jgi:regulator of protease activity HflC (stomatin/prohibitin superfamily)